MDEIIAEADDRMLMMDYDEDEGKVFFVLIMFIQEEQLSSF